jgi:threonine aldolase
MNTPRINLYSDTQTRPTPAMRRAMAEAEVGDEQRGEDPTVNRLCETAAGLLGKEAAVFLPSGTMCNEIALLVHCRPGDEIIAEESAHIVQFEGGGPAAFAGAMVRGLPGRHGVLSPEAVAGAIREDSRYAPRSRLLVVEQTANMAGGTVWPLGAVEAATSVARRQGLATHMDGARLLNAVVATGVPAARWAAPFDAAWIDLSKGLGCPVGAVIAADRDTVREIWRWKQRMGGAMRQAGIIAAAGLHALEHHVERLAEDHDNARRLAELVAECPGIAVDLESVQTNMVFMEITAPDLPAPELCRRLEALGIRIGAMGPRRMRAVTHLDVDRAGVEEAARHLHEVMAEAGVS